MPRVDAAEVALDQAEGEVALAGETVEQRLPHPERILLDQQVANPHDAQAGALEQANEARPGEVGAMPRHVLVKPPVAADPGLEARQVRHRDDQPAAGREPLASPGHDGSPGRRCARARARRRPRPGLPASMVGLLRARVDDRRADPRRGLTGARRRLDPVRLEPRRGQHRDEAPVAGADLEHPRPLRHRGEEPQAVALGQPPQGREQRRERPPLRRVGAALVQGGGRIVRVEGDRGPAGAAAVELVAGLGGELRVGGRRKAPPAHRGRAAGGACGRACRLSRRRSP